jgi:capsular polysaccharide biosynthesis protein
MTIRNRLTRRVKRATTRTIQLGHRALAAQRSPQQLADRIDRTFFAGTGLRLEERRLNVAVLAGPDADDLGVVLDAFAGSQIRVFSNSTQPDWRLVPRGVTHVAIEHIGQIAWHFKRFGPFDVIINCLPAGKDGQFYAWRRLFLHLRPDGSYVLDRRVVTASEWKQFIHGVSSLAPIRAVTDSNSEPELSTAVKGVVCDRNAMVITKRNDHWLKLRNEETDRFLHSRDVPATSRIISTTPEGTFESRASLDLHESEIEPPDFPRSFDYPQLYLHEYTGDITLASHSLLFTEHTILPESFRYQQVPTLTNTKLIESPASLAAKPGRPWTDFARVPENLHAELTLDGHYFHLDCPYPGHFGHLMTEVVSRMWGWEQAKRDNPELKAILRVYRGDRTPRLEKTILTAYGIDADDVVWTGEPVRLRSIVGATPMWQNYRPHYVHPDILPTWRRLGDCLIEVNSAPVPEKIFVSRQGDLRRSCRNGRQVEAYFADKGFEIVYPETLDLAQQATIFSRARVVAGFGGSAMFNILFGRRLEKVIVVTHESYTARNEYLYASVLGCEIHYVWSNPDLRHPADDWSDAAFQSSWDFDFARNRTILDKIVD